MDTITGIKAIYEEFLTDAKKAKSGTEQQEQEQERLLSGYLLY